MEATAANVRTVTKVTTARRILMGARLILVKTVAHAGTVLVTSAVSAAWDSRGTHVRMTSTSATYTAVTRMVNA